MHFVLGRLLRPAPAHPWTSDMETATKSTTLWWAHELHLDLRARPLQRSDLVSADKTLVELKHFISSQYDGRIKLELAQLGCGHWSNELATSTLLDNGWQSGQMILTSNAFHSENMMLH